MDQQPSTIACLCFSKDRPIQLEGYIKSLQRFASEKISITIIYCVSNEKYQTAYDKLVDSFPDVEFILEKNFRRHVSKWIKTTQSPYVLFGVDDWIYRKNFDVSVIKEAFKDPDLYGFSLRLGMEITYSGMNKGALSRPRFFKRDPYLLWEWTEDPNHIDWSYPFEVCATVYRRESVQKVLAILDTGKIKHHHWPDMSSENWGHPSKLEALANIAIRNYDTECPKKMASFPEAKGSLITVNRVQDECENFVYGETQEMDTEELLNLWNNGYEVDIDSFEKKIYTTIHIGDFFLRSKTDPSDVPFKSESNIYEVMMLDLLERLEKANNPAINAPAFIDFQNLYREYFSKPNAETHAVRISPVLQKKETDYFYCSQSHWFISRIKELLDSTEKILDVGTNIELIATASAIIPATTFQMRDEKLKLESLEIINSSIQDAGLKDKSQTLITSLSFIESLGMGQYGEPLDPEAGLKTLKEIRRITSPGGRFIGSMTIGRDSFIDFNKRRGVEKAKVLEIFPDFELISETFLFPDPGKEEDLQEMHDFKHCLWCFELKRN